MIVCMKEKNLYTTQQVAEMTGKTPQAVRAWALQHPGVGKMWADVWMFTDADVAALRAVRRGPKRKPKPTPSPTQPAPVPTP